jgi:hypothetical protein
MTTQKQIESNRLNAQKSTGPRTPEGRAASSQNALKYGLTAEQIVISGETPGEYLAFHRARVEVLQPADPVEEGIVERIIVCEWRLRRTYRAEAGLMSYGGPEEVFHGMSGDMVSLSRYETNIDRALQRARHDLERQQARRRGEAVQAPIAVTISGSVDVNDVNDQPPPLRKHRPAAAPDDRQMSLPHPSADIHSADNQAEEDVPHGPSKADAVQ